MFFNSNFSQGNQIYHTNKYILVGGDSYKVVKLLALVHYLI